MPQPNGYCDHSEIGGATEEDYRCVEDMGLEQADTTAITDAWRANMLAIQKAVIQNGGFVWQYFFPVATPAKGDPAACAAFFRDACAVNSPTYTSTAFLQYTDPHVYPLTAFKEDLATFLLVRGPHA